MVKQFKLDMNIMSAYYTFDASKVVIDFSAEQRIDFRELVRSLASALRTRIELHQVGARDEVKALGALGVCGQECCCKRFAHSYPDVSIKMAKEQGLSLNPTKISGSCGRLMCCLNYEQESYEYLNSITPSVGSTVKTELGVGIVTDVNFITGNLTVKPKEGEGAPYKTNRKPLKILGAHKPQKAEDNKE